MKLTMRQTEQDSYPKKKLKTAGANRHRAKLMATKVAQKEKHSDFEGEIKMRPYGSGKPYNNYMHTYGPVAREVGLDNKSRQLFGASNVGIQGIEVGISTLIIVGSVAAYTVGGVINAFSDGYFLGRARKKGVTYKNIATRNAVLGGALGAAGAALYLARGE